MDGLVSDAIVVGIVADRFMEPDAQRGFILDGFPRTVAQAEALDLAMSNKAMKLNAILELAVDQHILLGRIQKRVDEMRARGETVRPDDTPEVFGRRLETYQAQTAPVSAYYGQSGRLKLIDGMASIDEVSAAIDRALGSSDQSGAVAAE